MAIESISTLSLTDFERQDAACSLIYKARGMAELIRSSATSKDAPDSESLAAVAWSMYDMLGEVAGLVNTLGKGA